MQEENHKSMHEKKYAFDICVHFDELCNFYLFK